jgi:general stress protein YciG
MAAIGRKGGETVSRDRQHMATIGREGGESRGRIEPGGEEGVGPIEAPEQRGEPAGATPPPPTAQPEQSQGGPTP